ncbi:heat shock factor protein 2 isoform X2 [Clinocottus analis]|uniref:heat shock factor protein 2 isoform X2 n=1 Tax=Clinocottus analis TaxID=304258 RepID=UPI0035C0D79F
MLEPDGFRKVMHIDTGIVKQEKDGPVEFQHPYFKHGQDNLLENIKRKVSNTRPEDNKMRQEDLSQILTSVHSVHSKQESIDMRLGTLKRENEALWREISDLRQIHAHQQQLIKKLIHFIVTLVQNNRILNLKRKRPVLMNSNAKKPKYIHQMYDDQACVDQSPVNSQSGVKGAEVSDDVIICDLTESDAEGAEGSPRAHEQGDIDIVEVELDSCAFLPAETDVSSDDVRQAEAADGGGSAAAGGGGSTAADGGGSAAAGGGSAAAGGGGSAAADGGGGSALQLNKSLSLEDPVKIMDSILKESGAISQNINLLGKMELMDYLDSIDCSLEDFQAMLYGKQFSMDFDGFEEAVSSKENTAQLNRGRTEDGSAEKQLIQYTSCPLLAILDSCITQPDLDPGPSSSSFAPVEAEPPTDLLASGPEPRPPARSSLIRLEPLTEAEASAESLFYLCELSPVGAEGDAAAGPDAV